MVVCTIISKRDEIDGKLQEIDIGNMDDIKYISLKHTSSEDKVESLHINNMNDRNIRFESLLEANAKEEVVFQKERDNLR